MWVIAWALKVTVAITIDPIHTSLILIYLSNKHWSFWVQGYVTVSAHPVCMERKFSPLTWITGTPGKTERLVRVSNCWSKSLWFLCCVSCAMYRYVLWVQQVSKHLKSTKYMLPFWTQETSNRLYKSTKWGHKWLESIASYYVHMVLHAFLYNF